jgi:hypothetical protein
MPVDRRHVSALALLALASASIVGCVDISAGNAHYSETVEKRFPVVGTPTLHVSTFDGSVEVEAWDRPEIVVTIEKIGADKATTDRMIVNAAQDGDLVTIEVRQPREGGLHWTVGPFSARVHVNMPAQGRVEADTGDGRVAVRDVAGDLRVRTGDGAIRLEHVSGAVDAASGDGSVDIDGAISTLKVRSGDGRMRLRTSTPSATGQWEVATGDGTVILEVPDSFGAELDALTGDGRVRVDGVEFSGELDRHDPSRARGRLGAGGARITIRSGDGGITVRRADAS